MWEPVRHLIASENENYGSKFRENGVVVERQQEWRRPSSRDHMWGQSRVCGFSTTVYHSNSKAFLDLVDIIFFHTFCNEIRIYE